MMPLSFVLVSLVVFLLVHPHNDRYIYLRDKENAHVNEFTKTAHRAAYSGLQVAPVLDVATSLPTNFHPNDRT